MMLEETLNTTLFKHLGSHRTFIHKQIAEYLAARFLCKQEISSEQVFPLFRHPELSSGRIVPYLRDTVIWYARYNQESIDKLKDLICDDPKVFLFGDLVSMSEEFREAVAESLLKAFQDGKAHDGDIAFKGKYEKLRHPKLVGQLKFYLTKNNISFVARRAAIHIAEACDVQGLQPQLLTIALDETEDHHIRCQAARVVARNGRPEYRKNLRPFVEGDAGEDPNDDLKAYGLIALWPEFMSAKELFESLTPPKKERYIGHYELFADYELPKSLSPSYLPVALDWISRQLKSRFGLSRWSSLKGKIIKMAWENLDAPGILEAFAKALWSRFLLHDDIFHPKKNETIINPEDVDKRRSVLMAILHNCNFKIEELGRHLIYNVTGIALVTDEDLPWLIEKYQDEGDPAIKDALSEIINLVFSPFRVHDHETVNAILGLAKEDKKFREKFSAYIDSVDRYSKEAQRSQSSYYEDRKIQKEIETGRKQKTYEHPNVLIGPILEKIQKGQLVHWFEVVSVMQLDEEGLDQGHNFHSLLQNPGWPLLAQENQRRVLAAAKKYIFDYDPYASREMRPGDFDINEIAGYKALDLIFHLAPEFLKEIPVKVWSRWIHSVMSVKSFVGDPAIDALEQIAYDDFPDEFIKWLNRCIEMENRKNGNLSSPHKVMHLYDDRLEKYFLGKMKDRELGPKSMGTLLRLLTKRDVTEAKDFAKDLLAGPYPFQEERRDEAVEAACALILSPTGGIWSFIWSPIQSDEEFGKLFFKRLVDEENIIDREANLPIREEEFADLYIWLENHYPGKEDPKHDEFMAYTVTFRDLIGRFREGIIRRLKGLGSRAAVHALQRISKKFPDKRQRLQFDILDAEERFLESSWIPPDVGDFKTLIEDSQRRLVRNPSELMKVVLASLDRLEKSFHDGELPAVRDVWNEVPEHLLKTENGEQSKAGEKQNGKDMKYFPKNENALSDRIARHLQGELEGRRIVVDREVQVNWNKKTDIKITAFKPEESEAESPCKLVIEVKGFWNKDLKTAMEKQLIGEYLFGENLSHGIYLVGWFYCSEWWEADNRKKRNKSIFGKKGIEQARDFFRKQAKELQETHRNIILDTFVLDATK